MTNQNHQILGNKKRTSRFNPDLAEQINKAVERGEFNPQHTPEGEETPRGTLPSEDLSFIQDQDLYNEFREYLETTFLPAHQDKLSQKLSYVNGVMKGSNSYIAVAMDMFLKQQRPSIRTATQADLETDLQKFKEFYVDTGLALRNLTQENKQQGIHLFKQLNKRGISERDLPLWINLRGLTLDNNLNFNLTDESQYKIAQCLNWKLGTHYSQTDDFGLPTQKDLNSSRQIWTVNYSLSRAYLDKYSGLDSSYPSLADSNDSGRVVVAKPRSG